MPTSLSLPKWSIADAGATALLAIIAQPLRFEHPDPSRTYGKRAEWGLTSYSTAKISIIWDTIESSFERFEKMLEKRRKKKMTTASSAPVNPYRFI
jgi:hypothetical protein